MKNETNMSKFVLNSKEAAEYLGIGENLVRACCITGRLKHFKTGKNYRIPVPDAQAFALNLSARGASLDASEILNQARLASVALGDTEDEWKI